MFVTIVLPTDVLPGSDVSPSSEAAMGLARLPVLITHESRP